MALAETRVFTSLGKENAHGDGKIGAATENARGIAAEPLGGSAGIRTVGARRDAREPLGETRAKRASISRGHWVRGDGDSAARERHPLATPYHPAGIARAGKEPDLAKPRRAPRR